MNNERKMSVTEALINLLVIFPISVILSGYVISYGWNNILTTIDGVQKITIIQAIGIDLLVSYIIFSSGKQSNNYNFETIVSNAIIIPTVNLLMFHLVSLFL